MSLDPCTLANHRTGCNHSFIFRIYRKGAITWLIRHLQRRCLSLPCQTSRCHGIFQSHLLISQLHLRLMPSPAPHLWQRQLKCSLDSHCHSHCQIVFGSIRARPAHFLKLGLTHLLFDLHSSCLTRWTLQPSVLDYSFASWCLGFIWVIKQPVFFNVSLRF